MARRGDRLRELAPVAFVAVNAVAFCVVRPDVPDLWAARARAAAVADGVGLTYWFSWFGGSTPAGYSVLTPFVCALVGSEVAAAAAAVAISVLVLPLVRDTPRPTAAAWFAAAGVLANLWCGRVPFLLGGAFAVAAILLVRRRRTVPAAVLAVLSVLASPVAGAFVAVSLSGVVLVPRMRAHRVPAAVAAACAVGTLALIAVAFGSPGPEPFSAALLADLGLAIGLMLLLAPTAYLRVTLAVAAVVTLAVYAVPNALGGNVARLTLFCLPAAAVALSRRRPRVVAVLMAPVLVLTVLTSMSSFRSAVGPASHASYYAALGAELETRSGLADHRLELVSTGWAAYATLAGEAMLARGWETQTSLALDAELASEGLDASAYRAWLDDNAVGYVAVDTRVGDGSPEALLVRGGHLPYLKQVWSQAGWRLYAVRRPTPIVGAPARVGSWTQAALNVDVPRPGTTLVRVRWSPFLTASPAVPGDEDPTLAPGPGGWTTLTTRSPGTYVLEGVL